VGNLGNLGNLGTDGTFTVFFAMSNIGDDDTRQSSHSKNVKIRRRTTDVLVSTLWFPDWEEITGVRPVCPQVSGGGSDAEKIRRRTTDVLVLTLWFPDWEEITGVRPVCPQVSVQIGKK